MGTLWAITIYTLLVGAASLNIPSRMKTTQPTPVMSFTTRLLPTFTPEIKKEEEGMSPPRQEHTSKHIESVIYEPLPRIVLSRSTYKITSFIEFPPY